jgi:hypothetical protein
MSSLKGKVCAFCNKYRIKDLMGFIQHLKECNPKEYQEFMEILRGKHEEQK